MVYYNEIPEVNKRMVAGYYLFLCLIGFAILLGPTGSGIPITLVGIANEHEDVLASPNPGGTVGNGSYGCGDAGVGCHAHPEEYNYWLMTSHFNSSYYNPAINSTHVFIGDRAYDNATFNSDCARCHTTNYNETDHTFDAYGINCLECHNLTSPWVDYSGDKCGECHTGEDAAHPYQYYQWGFSAHANSLTDLRASGHPSYYCMHCMSAEAFIHQQNPGTLADTNPDVGSDKEPGNFTLFDPNDPMYNAITCPACHQVHGSYSVSSPAMIRAANATELCGLCHVGDNHPMYEVWVGGSHHLAGVECIDCHGYQLVPSTHSPTGWAAWLNHSFALNLTITCGQDDGHISGVSCHGEELETWALGQLQMTHDAFEALIDEFNATIVSIQAVHDAYVATAGHDATLAATLETAIGTAEGKMDYYINDGSDGFHDTEDIFGSLNDAYRALLEAEADFYEGIPDVTVTETVTETVTVTHTVTVIGGDTLLLVGGSVGGIVIGLVLGVLVGRRR
ncbi:MAG: ammonia-forming cytochrome c nitrite reductase subunit c552 [Candidatus Thorarchaeota archaeon SMTZ1-83]